MRLYKVVVLVIFLAIQFSDGQSYKSYNNCKVYSVLCEKDTHLDNLVLWEDNQYIDFWSLPGPNKTSSILVDPRMQHEFEEFLIDGNYNYKILIDNVEETLESHKRSLKNRRAFNTFSNVSSAAERDFSHYWNFDEIEEYIEFLSKTTKLFVKKILIGTSYEGRPIHALTISLDEIVGNLPILFIDSGIHAREWAGHMSVLYLLNQLVEHSAENIDLLLGVDWVVVPVVNPDGYVYTHETDRFWRKNRKPINKDCVGVDLNRNFGYGWQPAGKSSSPCSMVYPGVAPNSEPEAKALGDFMARYKYKMKLYVSMHSYASFLLYPYSFDFVYISNWKQHQELCQIFVDTINKITKFDPYSFGHSASEFYLASGVSDDHVIKVAQSNMAIVVELPGGGTGGFDFPEENIEALVIETFQGLRQFGLYVAENFYI